MAISRNTPIISVVVGTFNRAELLRNTIDSLIDQTLSKRDYEIIIVDNNSQDETLDLAKKYQGIRSEPQLLQ